MTGGPTHLDSARGWVTACGAAMVVMAAFGTIYSFTTFAKSMAEEFDTGLGPVSVVFGITVFLFFGSALVSGRLYDRYGIVPLLAVGGAMFCTGLYLTSHVTVLWHGYVLFGVGLGFGGGLFNAPLFALIAMWFARHRAMAQGVVATGSGVGTMVYAPFAQSLLERSGWRTGMRTLTVVAAVVFLIAMFMIKRPPRMEVGEPARHVKLVVRTPAFWQMGLSGVFFTIAVIGSLGLVVPFAQNDGIPARAAVALFSIIGFSSIAGRLALTSMARPLGSIRLLKIAFFGLPVAYVLWFATTQISQLEPKFVLLIVFAAVLGISYGGFVALLGDVTAHLFGLVGIGTVMGMLFFSSGLGALIGPPLMGFTSDASGGIVLPIIIALVVSSIGVAVLMPLTRHPLPLPTYIGPGALSAAPPPEPPATAAQGAALAQPLVPVASAASLEHESPGAGTDEWPMVNLTVPPGITPADEPMPARLFGEQPDPLELPPLSELLESSSEHGYLPVLDSQDAEGPHEGADPLSVESLMAALPASPPLVFRIEPATSTPAQPEPGYATLARSKQHLATQDLASQDLAIQDLGSE